MRLSIVLPCLLAACTTRIKFDDINIDANADDIGIDTDDTDDTDVTDPTGTPIDSGTTTTSPTEPGGNPRITGAGGTCFANDQVEFAVSANKVMSAARLFQEETGNANIHWSENHPFDNSNGNDSTFYLILDDGTTMNDPVNDWRPGSSTVFTCPDFFDLPDVMTYAVQVDDAAGNPADCIVFGDDPQGMIDRVYDRVNEPEFDLLACRIESP